MVRYGEFTERKPAGLESLVHGHYEAGKLLVGVHELFDSGEQGEGLEPALGDWDQVMILRRWSLRDSMRI